MSLFILISKDNWLDIMYSGIDAVGVDKQPIKNYNEWMIIYFITFLLFGGFFMFNTFVGVIIENFIKCRALQKIEENERNFAKRFRKFKRARIGDFYYFIQRNSRTFLEYRIESNFQIHHVKSFKCNKTEFG